MSNPRNWMLFRHLDETLIEGVKTFFVFGENGSSVLFVTREDQVYAFGCNESGVLGVGDDAYTLLPRAVPELEGKGIIKFAAGGHHVLALTSGGHVFAWGSNGDDQLARASHEENLPNSRPQQIGQSLKGQTVVDVACGSGHSVALTSGGELFTWGLNSKGQLGCEYGRHSPYPSRVSIVRDIKVRSVVCGASSTHVLTADGQVFSWGLNDFRQLGLPITNEEHTQTHMSQAKLTILPQGVTIVQIASGSSHCLALTNRGDVYSWGRSDKGQLGRGEIADYGTGDPLKVTQYIGKVVEVAAVNYRELSAALTCDGQVYVWGMGMKNPVLTAFKSLQEAFSCFAQPNITYKQMVVDDAPATSIAEALRKSFNDETTSDVKFSVDSKLIHVYSLNIYLG